MHQHGKTMAIEPFAADVFTVPFNDGHILYVPAAGLIAGVDDRVHNVVQAIKRNEPIEDSSFHREFVSILEKLGVFNTGQRRKGDMLDEFRPKDVTLSLTSRCHLRCVYCYASAGERIADMDREVMDAALVLVADNTVQRDEQAFTVSFHGEGEPTANWDLFQEAVNKSKQLASERGLKAAFTMSTNGMWSHSQRKFVADHFPNLSISFDGPPEIQNVQRPTASGASSFSIVFDNLMFLEERGVDYGIRATVLPNGLDRMIPFLDLIVARLKCNSVHFEPVFLTGRAADYDLGKGGAQLFFRQFLDKYHRAVAHGSGLGIHVTYSGCRTSYYGTHFCHAAGPNPNFFVSTQGIVSSCYEIIDPTSAKGRFTVYGRYDRERRRFVFDQQKLQRIRTWSVLQMTHCRDCYVRWNCAGDCFARSDVSLDDKGEVVGSQQSPRCFANREATLRELVYRGLLADLQGRAESQTAKKGDEKL